MSLSQKILMCLTLAHFSHGDAVAILTMGGTVSHHTGNASHTGRRAGIDGMHFAELIVAYGVGAAVEKSGTTLKTTVASHALAVAAVVRVTSTAVSKQEPPPAPPAQVPVERRATSHAFSCSGLYSRSFLAW